MIERANIIARPACILRVLYLTDRVAYSTI
jgi:hypothetical protein